MGALSEFGIAPQEDLLEASPATEANRLVEVEFGLLLRGPVAAAVDQVKRLSGVGQRDQQRMITPGAVVGDVDALLALGVGLDEGAIALDDRLGKELGGLLGPTRSRVSLTASIRVTTSCSEKRRQKSRRWWGRGSARRGRR